MPKNTALVENSLSAGLSAQYNVSGTGRTALTSR
jgi:hypothetical protein